MTVFLLLAAIIALLALRVPIGFAFLGPSLLYMMVEGQSLGQAVRLMSNSIASFPLLAVPLFILLGVIAVHAGIAARIYDFAMALLGRVRGGLGYVNVGVSLGFSWMSGSAVADAAALGKVQVPQMVRYGYSKPFALGVTGAAALIAPIMPPSIPAVIFSGQAAVSTGKLFAASVIPALLMALGLCIAVWVLTRHDDNIQQVPFDRSRLAAAARGVVGPALAPVIILGGILSGAFTPTEAAAIGAGYMFVLGLVYRTITLRDVPRILSESVTTAASIMLIVASAALLGYILALERVPQLLSEAVLGFTSDGTVYLVLVAVLMLILGTVMDATAILVLVIPMLMPIAKTLDVDPILLGVVMILSLMIGLLTPPVGTVLFVLSATLKVPVGQVFRGSLPFIVPLLVLLVAIILVPGIALWLPEQLGL
ncbi:TRAP transporter large permease [Ornithinimicrobium tianjinense]|uniref:ABC transporter permease n=1 Tax=Ornithinimicrobium tianjinense TaxID=1195761 RepID=A0A917BH00_9MICO|nr:TRAP transporter large permease [Ornithinimicrobium tianjinense]GGF40691.1 ABC transporter permease [Ornithinimicrobium tianjinense]